MSTKFIFFEATEGGQIAVNVANVTYVRPRVDGNGMFIAFLGEDGSAFQGRCKKWFGN